MNNFIGHTSAQFLKRFSHITAVLLGPMLSCTYDVLPQPFNCQLSDLHAAIDTVLSAADCTIQDGAIHVTATGGKPPYTFLLNGGQSQSQGNFENISAGIHTVSVKDGLGCEVTLENISVSAQGLSFHAIVREDNDCLAGNGSVTITVLEGNGPYLFQYGSGNFESSNTFTGLSYGTHMISVKDNAECIFKLNVTVPRAYTGISWLQEILPIIEAECATEGCHNGISRPDLRMYNNAKFYASFIKKYTQEGSMPFDGTLAQEQIDLIACWVDDGALEN